MIFHLFPIFNLSTSSKSLTYKASMYTTATLVQITIISLLITMVSCIYHCCLYHSFFTQHQWYQESRPTLITYMDLFVCLSNKACHYLKRCLTLAKFEAPTVSSCSKFESVSDVFKKDGHVFT